MPVVEVRFEATGDIRRISNSAWPELNYLHMRLSALRGITLIGPFLLKYSNPAGDLVSIVTQDDLQEAITTMGGSDLLNLIVVQSAPSESGRPPSSAVPSPSPARPSPTRGRAAAAFPPRPQALAPPPSVSPSSAIRGRPLPTPGRAAPAFPPRHRVLPTRPASSYSPRASPAAQAKPPAPAIAGFNHCGVCFTPPTSDGRFCPECGTPFSPASPITRSAAASSTPRKAVEYFSTDMLDIRHDLVLGRGAFGRVVKGTVKRTGAQVAIKLFDLTSEQLEEVVGDIQKEAELMSGLDHPNLVGFIGYMDCTLVALVLELMQGNLFTFLHNHDRTGRLQPLNEELQVRFMTDIASGLAYLHASSIWHRDLKSPNVLLDANQRCKLADFGFAKHDQQAGSVVPLSKTIGQIGTESYNAPEVIGLKPYNEAGDLYALGVLFWEICSRVIPWKGFSAERIKDAVFKEKERLPDIGSLPRLFGGMVWQLTSWDPRHRPRVQAVLAVLIQAGNKSNLQGTAAQSKPKETEGTVHDDDKLRQAIERQRAEHERTPVDQREGGFNAIVYDAAGRGDLDQLRAVLASHGHLIDTPTPNERGCTPLYNAARNGHAAAVELLVRLGSTAIDTPAHNGWTPLNFSAYYGHASVIEALVQLGSKAIDIPNNKGATPMYNAAHNGHVSAIELLVRLGSTAIDTPNNNGWTPLHAAAQKGHVPVIEALVRLRSTAIDIPNNNGWTPINTAAQKGHVPVIEALVRLRSTAIDTPNNDGWTPLNTAAERGHVPVIEALVRLRSTAIDAPDNNGWTPLHSAAMNGHVSVIEALVRLGSNVINTKTKAGFTPLQIALDAFQSNNKQVLQVLLNAGAERGSLSSADQSKLTKLGLGT